MNARRPLSDAEHRMLHIARVWGWHALRSDEEFALARRLERAGHGRVVNCGPGHDSRFEPKGRLEASCA